MNGWIAAPRMTVFAITAAACLVAASPGRSLAQDDPTTYSDGRGGEIHFPMGDRSFADELVSFEVGDPDAGAPSERPEQTLGPPDFVSVQSPGYLTLGCGGVLVAAFTDNSLIDVPGIDLHIFEIGPNVEPTALAISSDGETWTRVGMISGGRAAVDIAPYIAPGTSFRYVKLVDLMQSCRSYPGADIDAIGAVGSATKITLGSAVLFDSGECVLKEAATEALSEVAAALPSAQGVRIVVAGHTDSVGSNEDNLILSQNRAEAVATFLRANTAMADEAITIEAYGES